MKPSLLVRRGMRHYWRTHLGVALGVACAAMVLVGALAVGDSVRASLREQAHQRIGRLHAALVAGDRFVTARLAELVGREIPDTTCVPVMQLPGVGSTADGGARAGIVDVFGVDAGFFAMSTRGTALPPIPPERARISRRLARQLDVGVGDAIVIRVERPSLMPREATMATVDDVAHPLRVEIETVLDDDEFGRFGLRASQVPPFNVFVALQWLQTELELPDRANLLLTDADAAPADAALRRHWTLADAELEISDLGDAGRQLASRRVFLDPSVGRAMRALDPNAYGVLTYFVNSLRAGDRVTPYSMVSAIGPLSERPRTTTPPVLRGIAPPDLGSDEIVLNDWLAADLGAEEDATVELTYFVMDSELRLEERSHTLAVHSIVPLAGAAADRRLMPDFPGLAEAKSCADWDPGIPIELDRLDDADEKYWEDHAGTPKAFVRLDTGQALWQNRFGNLTAVRTSQAQSYVEEALPQRLDPAALGLFFRDLRGPALAAGAPATDFGGLFLGLSVFLIVAALLLTALLFVFGVEQRHGEIGALLAFGYRPRTVRGLFFREAAVLGGIGCAAGAALGIGYSWAILEGLGSLWRDAVGQTSLTAHVEPTSVLVGTAAAFGAALGAIWLTLRKAFRRPAVELLAARAGAAPADAAALTRRIRWSAVSAVAAVAAAAALAITAGAGSAAAAGTFFGAGALLLAAALLSCRIVLLKASAANRGMASVAALGARNTGRRPGRSLATITLLASGTFLVVAVQANRLAPPADPAARASGTGGFALFGRSTLPVLRDLATPEGREAYALDDDDLDGVAIVPLRVRDGDDASCLNLSLPQNPRLVGVRPAELAARHAFRFAAHEPVETVSPWTLLEADYGEGVVPAIGDAASVTWTLHKSVGDALRYRDDAGNEFDVRIVGTVADSILQGSLVVADRHLRQRFPSASGYRMFLVDAPPERVEQVSADLTRALADLGLELTPTGERLAAFQAVQNTYLAIFQLLGGLGLLLGTVGLGIVVLRNALERRSELAVLGALGFPARTVRRLVFGEHGLLLLLGLAAGALAALLAVLPVVRGPDGVPVTPMVLLVLAIAASGAFWVWLAGRFATRGELLETLQGE